MKRINLKGGVAVVSGAASGIGRATALALAQRGCAVALVDRDASGLAETARLANAHRQPAVTQHVVDVADADALAALPAEVLDAHERVTAVVAAAGVSLVGRTEDVSMDEIKWLMDINLFGVIGLVKGFLPALQREPAAQVVTVSSLFGIIAPAEQAAYAASKFAVRGFSEALRHELADGTVGVTVVHPGGVATGIARNARIAQAADTDTERGKSDAFESAFLKTPPEKVGEAIARAIERRKPRLIVASGARAGVALQRLMPVRYWRVLAPGYDRLTRRLGS